MAVALLVVKRINRRAVRADKRHEGGDTEEGRLAQLCDKSILDTLKPSVSKVEVSGGLADAILGKWGGVTANNNSEKD